MAGKYKAPGVYIEEMHSLPSSIAQVETAVPAFIGYTETANREGQSVINQPIRISSLLEYISIFGERFKATFDILAPRTNEIRPILTINGSDNVIDFTEHNKAFLYSSLKLYFDNGGGPCFIVSVGTYENQSSVPMHLNSFFEGLNALRTVQTITLIIIPEAVNLNVSQCYEVYQKMLEHCGEMQNRFSILDIHNGFLERNRVEDLDVITNFRDHIGSQHLSYGAAYYPWLNTITTPKSSVTFEFINLELMTLSELLPETNVTNLIEHYLELNVPTEVEKQDLHSGLQLLSPNYVAIIDGIHDLLNVLPPSAAMAGIYVRSDSDRGVWNAPANISLSNVISPSIHISDSEQVDLNVDPISGKSINAIRSFIGRGILVWGARTLDGNSNDWRYINVKRTIITIEESIKLAILQYVFEPNTSNTWVLVKNMIENYLNTFWRDGALAGSRASEAYGVQIGLGSTMTGLDIQEGKMKITVFVAILRPAEFIVLNFEQQMQAS